MPLLRAHAETLSQNDVVQGIIEELITVNEIFELMPFVQVNGKAYVYKRENTSQMATTGVTYYDPDDAITESSAQYTEIVTRLRILAGDVDVDKFLLETMSDTEDQLATQIATKVKVVGRAFMNSMVNGSNVGNPKEFDGIKALVTAGQTINAAVNGAALTLTMLDQLVDTVNNGADAIVMRMGTRRAFVQALRSTGYGTDAIMLQLPNLGKPVLTHGGVPILVNDYLPANETLGTGTNLCSIYAARFNELDGVHGLSGGSAAGIRVETVGTVQNKDAIRTRVKWYCGMALKSTLSLARLQGITNT